jgi:hypothetical protein
MIMGARTEAGAALMLPETLQAPHLRHLALYGHGELPLELLPELQELTFTGSGDVSDAFTSFIDARQNAGHPVTLARSPGTSESSSSSALVITSGSSEAGNGRDT